MRWVEEVERELLRAEEAERVGNSGKARTSSRRAVGFALEELRRLHPERTYGRNFVEQLQGFSADPSIPLAAREAAERLQARLNLQFESPSKNPVEDARTIIDVITGLLQ
jgi:hypothetical protein